MLKKFRLWEYNDLKHPGIIEATVSVLQSFPQDTVDYVGNVELYINEIKWFSRGLPILPLKIFGGLEKLCKTKSERSKATIHMVTLNNSSFGYLVGEGDELQFQEGIFVLNKRKKVPLYANERRLLTSMRVLKPGFELFVKYKGVRGEVEAHNSTLSPKNRSKYCFSNVYIRAYSYF